MEKNRNHVLKNNSINITKQSFLITSQGVFQGSLHYEQRFLFDDRTQIDQLQETLCIHVQSFPFSETS